MAQLTDEQRAQREHAAALCMQASEIGLFLASAHSRSLTAAQRRYWERKARELRVQAKAITDQLPKTDPWGNIK